MPALRASMGYVGSVAFGFPAALATVRALSADIKASQQIDYPDVVDGRIDRTLYQLGPRIVGGGVSFPLVHEGVQGTTTRDCGIDVNFGQLFWRAATQRDKYGRLVQQFDTHIRYTDNTAFTYPGCIINSMTLNVNQSDYVSVDLDIIGGANSSSDVRFPKQVSDDLDYLSPARIVTWNDFVIKIFGDTFTDSLGVTQSNFTVPGEQIRSFNVTVNNNAERFYTLNNKLAPQDVAARKREISGTIALMGRNTQLSEFAYTNQDRFTSTSGIAFGYTLGSLGSPYFITGLHGVVFEIEEIAISNDLIETNVAFTALADCDANYEATQLGTSGVAPARPQNGLYGGPTASGFPGFGTGL